MKELAVMVTRYGAVVLAIGCLLLSRVAFAGKCDDGENVVLITYDGQHVSSEAPRCVYSGDNPGQIIFRDVTDKRATIDGEAIKFTKCDELGRCFFTFSVPAEQPKFSLPKIAVDDAPVAWAGTAVPVEKRGPAPAQVVVPPPPAPHAPATDEAAFVADYQFAIKKANAAGLFSKTYYDEVACLPDKAGVCQATPNNVYYDRYVSSDVAVIFYDAHGNPRGLLPQVDEDDTVLLVFSRDSVDQEKPSVTGCVVGPDLRIGGSAIADGTTQFAETQGERLPPFVISLSKCSSDSPIHVAGTYDTSHYDTQLNTVELHRITIGISLVYDASLSTSYTASPMKGENVPVISKDEHVRGILPPLATLSFRPYKVDSKRIRFWHRFVPAPTIGISLTEPAQHLFIGLLGEVLPGIGLIAGYHFHQEQVLTGGYQVGDRVSSGAAPTTMRWADPAARDWFFGVTLDVGVLTQILSKL